MSVCDNKGKEEIFRRAMATMGWNPNAKLPMANIENLSLLEEVEALMEDKVKVLDEHKSVETRSVRVKMHVKNTQMCVNQNLKLLQAHELDINRDIGLYRLADRMASKTEQDVSKLVKESEGFNEHVENIEKELCKRKNAIDDFTKRVQWAKSVLLEWQEAMKDSDKGFKLIEKYIKEDRILAFKKESARQLLHDDVERTRKELVRLYDEQKTLEGNLECTSKLYRQAHQERRHMVETWKSAVQQMLQREKAIRDCEDNQEDLQEEAKRSTEARLLYDKQLDARIKSNREIERFIEELNEETSEMKKQIQLLADAAILKENEVELLQKDLQNLSNLVLEQRQQNRRHLQEKTQKMQELKDAQAIIRNLEKRLSEMLDKTTSAQERLQMLEELNDAEEKDRENLNKETLRANGTFFRIQQQVVVLRDEVKTLEVNSSGLAVTVVSVKRKTSELEKELQRKQELLYNASFKLLKLEKTLINMMGGTVDPMQEEALQKQLVELERKNAQLNRRLQATEAQNKKLDYNMRNLTEAFNRGQTILEITNFKIKEAQMYCEGGIKRLSIETEANQLKIVELSIMKMRVTEFEKEISSHANNTFNLGRHRVQLNRTMKDRMVEIKSQMDLLTIKRKHLQEERATLLADIGDRNKHVGAVIARFELTSKLLGVNDNGTLVTATQLKVEAAQEKQLLLEEGDKLNEQVLKAEKEVEAMENTLQLLTYSNDTFRNNWNLKDTRDDTVEEKKDLQSRYCEALNELKELSSQFLFFVRENDKMSNIVEELTDKLNVLCSNTASFTEVLNKQQKELDDQTVKLKRASWEVKNALRELQERNLSQDFLLAFNRELELRELEHRNVKVLNQLVDIASDNGIGPKITSLIQDKGLKMPHQLQKIRSCSSWSSEISEMSSKTSRVSVTSPSQSIISIASSSASCRSSRSCLSVTSVNTSASVLSLDFGA